jgi:hypothetical protein
MWRTSFVAVALVAACLTPNHVEASHAGCVASPASPRCSYKATGPHRCAGYTDGTWEAYVMRPEKVVLASHAGMVVGAAGDVDAFPGEVVTVVINDDGGGGLVSCGHAAGHPPAESALVAILGAATANIVNVPLQPGAPLVIQQGLLADTLCTLNFVFEDDGKPPAETKTYIGTGPHCVSPGVGLRAESPQIGFFGTVVFWSNDFALIEVDDDKLEYVSPVMRGYGAAPSGYATPDQTDPGDLVVTYGWPAGWPADATVGVARHGALYGHGEQAYTVVKPMILDPGAPLVRVLDGKAIGVSNDLYLPYAGPTVQHILRLLEKAGFDVTLAE